MAKKLIGHDPDQVPVNGFLGNLAYIDTETDPTVGAHIKAITTTDISNWDAAYGWGDHSTAGYALSSSLGTIASQDANNVNIDGGAIDGTAIGASSASTGKFSALTLTGEIDEQVFALSGTTPSLDPANGTIQTWTLSGNSTPTDSLAEGESILLLVDDGTAYTITWPTMEWIGGSAPTLDTANTNVIELWKVGSTLYGALVGVSS